ncbi:MAG: LysR family transcriptional regulator [bacterium]|nr:LysR family transcriptional regulator [bacterium]
MNIKDMSCFVKVCENKSISATAESFFMSPQGISKAIKRMEDELKAELFIRTQNGVVPTEYGKIFYEHALNIIKEYEDTTKVIVDLKTQNNGLIRMASAFGILRFLSPEFIRVFMDKYPLIHLDYMEFPDRYIEENILNDKYDVGLVPYLEQDPNLEYIPLFSREICFVTHEKSQFYKLSEVSIREISSEPIIMENENFLIHHIMKDTATMEGIDLDIYFNTSGFSLCYKLCTENEGNTISMDYIFEDMKSENLKMLPFKEHPEWKVALIRKKGIPLSPNMESFIAYVKEWCKSL